MTSFIGYINNAVKKLSIYFKCINMEDFDNNEKYATYKQFAVDDEKSV
jgi:hypothetical protein